MSAKVERVLPIEGVGLSKAVEKWLALPEGQEYLEEERQMEIGNTQYYSLEERVNRFANPLDYSKETRARVLRCFLAGWPLSEIPVIRLRNKEMVPVFSYLAQMIGGRDYARKEEVGFYRDKCGLSETNSLLRVYWYMAAGGEDTERNVAMVTSGAQWGRGQDFVEAYKGGSARAHEVGSSEEQWGQIVFDLDFLRSAGVDFGVCRMVLGRLLPKTFQPATEWYERKIREGLSSF